MSEILWEASVRMPVAPMHAEARVSSVMVSQQLAGHHVDVLETSGEWNRVRGVDDYEGWMHVGYLARAPHAHGRQSQQSWRMSLGCVTEAAGGMARALPLCALLAPEETVKSGDALDASGLGKRFPLEAESIVASAQSFFSGTSYLWGGVTPWGADCSGFVQTVFALHSKQLPRDSIQQSTVGRDAGRDFAAFQVADLLFFSDREDRRITHVGIALANRRMVHLALGRGGYAVERLDDSTDPYVNRLIQRFICARRVL